MRYVIIRLSDIGAYVTFTPLVKKERKEMSFTGKVLKIGAAAVITGIAVKYGMDKYRRKKKEYIKLEEDSKDDLIRKYTAFFDRKLVEIEDGIFEGCELKTFSSKLVLDLSRATLEKDVYISIDVKGTSLTVVLPPGHGIKMDINNVFTKVTDHSKGIHSENTIYIIGRAWGSNIEIAPDTIYMDDDIKEEYDDFSEILSGVDATVRE